MLPKKLKITRQSFPSHREYKQIWNGAALRIFCYPPNKSEKKFSVVVSKKLFKKHVERNYFKRSVFEAAAKYQDVFNEIPFEKFVIYPTRSVELITNDIITLDLHDFFKKQNIHKAPH